MLNFLVSSRQGRFLIIGVVALILGFLTMPMNPTLSRIIFIISIFFLGFYATKNAVVDTIQEGRLNVDLLMVLAAVGAVLIGHESEGAVLLLIFAGAEMLENYANGRSTRAIEELMSQVPDTAVKLLANGDTQSVHVDELEIGDIIVVARGEQVPIDGVSDRQVTINESALTGESVPVNKEAGQDVFAGTINEGNVFQVKVTKLSSETIFSNIIRMVEEAENRPSKISRFIDRIESKYVTAVLITVPVFIALLYYVNGLSFQEAFYRGMVFLTVASPCALVASATPATLSAISNGARNGVLFKGGAAMEALSTMDVLFSDKTGTLTQGKFEVVNHSLDQELLKEVVFMEQQSSHPIAEAIVESFEDLDLSSVNTEESVQEVAGSGIRKGDLMVGKPSAFEGYADPNNYRQHSQSSYTTIFVGKENKIVGFFSLADQVRRESKAAVSAFQAEGVDVVLLTGDNELVAESVAHEVGIEDFQASLLPEDKINRVLGSQEEEKVVGMIGDGINDAPALANADIGIAMGSGSSVAMESSDVVIVQNDLSKLFYSYQLSQKLNTIIKQNVIFAVGVIVLLIMLNFIGVLPLPLAVVFHEGSTILVILNGLRLLSQEDKGGGGSEKEEVEELTLSSSN